MFALQHFRILIILYSKCVTCHSVSEATPKVAHAKNAADIFFKRENLGEFQISAQRQPQGDYKGS